MKTSTSTGLEDARPALVPIINRKGNKNAKTLRRTRTYSIGAYAALKALGIRTRSSRSRSTGPTPQCVRSIRSAGCRRWNSTTAPSSPKNGAILPHLASLNWPANLGAPQGSLELARIQEWIGFLNSDVQAFFAPIAPAGVPRRRKGPGRNQARRGCGRLNPDPRYAGGLV